MLLKQIFRKIATYKGATGHFKL